MVGSVALSDELALSRHPHDRLGNHRVDADWIRQRWEDPRTRVLTVHHGKVLVDGLGRPVYRSPAQTLPGEQILLGLQGDVTYFAVRADDEPDGTLGGLRQVGQAADELDAALVTHAIAVANWHDSHRFCPRCGGVLHNVTGGHVRRCEQCGRDQFPRTDPAVIMLVTDQDERCLLGHNTRNFRERAFSTLAGFVEPGESLEHAVRREIFEETGIVTGEVTYVGSQPWPLPASLMVGYFAEATSTGITVDGDEISEARWFSRDELLSAAKSEEVLLPGRLSISRRLIELWYGGELPGSW